MMAFQEMLALPAPKQRAAHIETLLQMLTYRRPNGSKTEREFIARYLDPLAMQVDTFGNYYKRIGDAPIMWSCHTDTVHIAGGRQQLAIKGDRVGVADRNSNCLGADCTAGVWMMTEMIKAKIPGLYIFHRAEEVGGKGSTWIADNTPELLNGIKYAIAFDRRDDCSIITHQFGGRCCSNNFASSLSDALGMDHVHDCHGSFTDTANYTELVGECTNLSVGYDDEHSKKEVLDLDYIDRLRSAVLQADFTKLVEERKAGDVEYGGWEDWGYGRSSYRSSRYGNYTSPYTGTGGGHPGWAYEEDQAPTGYRKANYSMARLVEDHPDEVADWLEENGLDADQLGNIIYLRGGALKT